MGQHRVTDEGRGMFTGALIEPSQHKMLTAYAEREDRSVAQIVRWAVQEWLVRHTPWRPPGRQEERILKKRPLA